ncbi:MAG TPA: serine/threonine-protein kinase [Thermoanaerobaculia bacterium]|nr:serine/threonine-protein kinase [Thermoanaerobaculia bacterium]
MKPVTSERSGSGGEKVRFTPGSIVAGRYRVVALLGRGGMGEVYRSEDMKLGQQVALKFLPREFALDADKLRRLHEEVRLGRQVAHPNVCRMYDISEWEGHHFISMEYIDGEDLASLLRRIGKLPHDKALDIARDVCAGLAAAHGLGIIHRDLKPANVMIDGRGDARITDFGLAALAADLEQRREVAGTPAYMAPEQLEGGAVTQKTDLYSLALIFYEMFIGKRLFEGSTFGEIVSRHKTSSSQSLSRETSELDPAVQRVILRCLEEDPTRRPGSIHSVIAALPGGDPLQAAIDAGETPSPEMIAAAGSTGELTPAIAWPLLILTVVVLIGAAAVSPRVRLYGQTDLPLEPFELAFRARQILATAGLDQRPADTVAEMGVDRDYRFWKREQNRSGAPSSSVAERIFSPLIFGYRESPAPMALSSAERVSAFGSEPALELQGMGQVILEPDGRLRKMIVVPPEELAPGDANPDWGPMWAATGLDAGQAEAVDPRWRPPVGSDRRFAWLVPVPDLEEPVRVEAASLAGLPVWFEAITPWNKPFQPLLSHRRPLQRFADLLFMIVLLGSLIIGGILANRNLRRGRGDRQGAWRVGSFVMIAMFLSSIFVNDHYWNSVLEGTVIVMSLAWALFAGVMMWIWYLALEPYLRRRWPRTLISWTRLLQWRWRDPLVGRGILIGVLAAAVMRLAHFVTLAVPSWLGWTPPIPWDSTFLEISGWKYTLGYLFGNAGWAVLSALMWMVVLLVVHLVLRQRSAAIAVVFVLMVLSGGFENYAILEWPLKLFMGGVVAWVMIRHGLVALAFLFFTFDMFGNFPMTLDPSVWYFDRSVLALTLLIGLAIFGFTRALGAQPLFAEPVLED